MKIKIAPSILSADFSCLDREIKKVEAAGADLIHVDVMDGHFVPNITIGPTVVKYLRKVTKLPLDVHLMIENPQSLIDEFIKAGSDMITVHIETLTQQEIKKLKSKLKPQGVKLGVSLNPDTPLNRIKGLLNTVDFILVMSVYPGFGGQRFIPAALPKIKALRSLFKRDISVDGGVNHKVAGKLIKAGANILASGSYIFSSKKPKQAIERLRNAKG
jgi:ribulose-phosphate 3-epimerase